MKKDIFIINTSKITGILLLIALLLAVIYLGLYFLLGYSGGYFVENIYPFFDLGDEGNLPAFYSSLLLLTASLLLYIISLQYAASDKKYKKQWLWLSLIFLFVSMDESINIHEKLGSLFKRTVGSTNLPDFLQYGWILPYFILLVFLGFYFFKFFLDLDRKTLTRFGIAFIVYVGGALGLEMIESKYHQSYGTYYPMYKIFVTIEEIMEMAGTIIFIRALLLHLSENLSVFGFKVIRNGTAIIEGME